MRIALVDPSRAIQRAMAELIGRPSSVRFRSGRWRKTPYLPSSPAAADMWVAPRTDVAGSARPSRTRIRREKG